MPIDGVRVVLVAMLGADPSVRQNAAAIFGSEAHKPSPVPANPCEAIDSSADAVGVEVSDCRGLKARSHREIMCVSACALPTRQKIWEVPNVPCNWRISNALFSAYVTSGDCLVWCSVAQCPVAATCKI